MLALYQYASFKDVLVQTFNELVKYFSHYVTTVLLY